MVNFNGKPFKREQEKCLTLSLLFIIIHIFAGRRFGLLASRCGSLSLGSWLLDLLIGHLGGLFLAFVARFFG